MRYQAVAGCSVVLLVCLLSRQCGLIAAESAGKLPLEALAGQVVDPSGPPAVGATVWLVGGTYDEDPKTLERTPTDAQGRFVFREVKSKYVPRKTRWPHVVVRDSQGRLGGEDHPWGPLSMPRQNLRMKLVNVEDCRGRLVDAASQPIAKAMICPRSVASFSLDDPSHRAMELLPELRKELECETGADGAFTLRGLPVRGSVVSKVTAAGFGSPQVGWDVSESVTLRSRELAWTVSSRLEDCLPKKPWPCVPGPTLR